MFGRSKPKPVSFTVSVSTKEPVQFTFNTIEEVNESVLDLLQSGATMNDINVEDSNGKPFFLTSVSFT